VAADVSAFVAFAWQTPVTSDVEGIAEAALIS